MTNKIVRYLSVLFFAYLGVSFVCWDFSIMNWHIVGRIIFALVFFGYMVEIFVDEEDDKERNEYYYGKDRWR